MIELKIDGYFPQTQIPRDVKFTLLGFVIHIKYINPETQKTIEIFFNIKDTPWQVMNAKLSMVFPVIADIFIKPDDGSMTLFDGEIMSDNNWGDSERDYSKAIKGVSVLKRKMVAMNDRKLKELSFDTDESVRIQVVKSLIRQQNNKKIDSSYFDCTDPDDYDFEEYEEYLVYLEGVRYFEPLNRGLGDISYLDKMMRSDTFELRYLIATLGIEHHLDFLANDENTFVRCAVANRASSRQIDMLIDDEKESVKLILSNNQNATIDQQDRLSYSDIESIQRSLVKRGFSNEHLSKSEYYWVRYDLASKGLYHETFVHDVEDFVREAVAESSNSIKLLSILLTDKSSEVQNKAKNKTDLLSGLISIDQYQSTFL